MSVAPMYINNQYIKGTLHVQPVLVRPDGIVRAARYFSAGIGTTVTWDCASSAILFHGTIVVNKQLRTLHRRARSTDFCTSAIQTSAHMLVSGIGNA